MTVPSAITMTAKLTTLTKTPFDCLLGDPGELPVLRDAA
jgi:hypothetical protein